MRTKLLLESLKGDQSDEVGVSGRMLLKLILGKSGLGVWIGLIWLKRVTDGGVL
jgi:hypothetical protein